MKNIFIVLLHEECYGLYIWWDLQKQHMCVCVCVCVCVYVTLKARKRSLSGKNLPQQVVALEKQPQREISCCGCF